MLFYIALFGLAITLYTIYVEKMHRTNSKYIAICDVNNRFSCTRVLKSDYAKMVGKVFNLSKESIFNVPNTYYGVIFYLAVATCTVYPFTLIPYRELLLLGASVLSLCVSAILGYIMHYKLGFYCIVCIITYFVNAVIFYYAVTEIF